LLKEIERPPLKLDLACLCDYKIDRRLKMSSKKEKYNFLGPIYLIRKMTLKEHLLYFNVGLVA
jgi:hypothetical protein